MKIGTRSVLFGAHQFLIHPLFVAEAWRRLYGFPLDPRLWVAFFVHDLGYLGRPNMDGPEGEDHPFLGARVMGWLFDWREWCPFCDGHPSTRWADFTLLHSRFMAKRLGRPPSRLCVADKLATVLTPAWLYLPAVNLTGEISEYMDAAAAKEGGRYANEGRRSAIAEGDQRAWFENMTAFMREWVEVHRDGRPDLWTPSPTKSAAESEAIS